MSEEVANDEEFIDGAESRQTIENGVPGKELLTDMMNDNSQRNLHQPSPSFDLRNDESNKQLIASMLKDSMLDFDNSRNDVVPQRT